MSSEQENKEKAAPSGLILLHKQSGVTSFDALRDIKRALGTGRVGHTGTLDKFAEGLLLILAGRALKLSRWFTRCDKQYEGTIRFGTETDTLDPEGSPVAEAPLPSREAVEQALKMFLGEIEQAPPAYSAVHVNGERASALARRGEAPEMLKRPVEIFRLELRRWAPPFAEIFAHCSGGTYIRSLARDIALAAGSRAHLVKLVRTQVAGFTLGAAEQRAAASGPLLPLDKSVFQTLGLPCLDISPEDAQKMIQGKPLARILEKVPQETLSGQSAAAFCGDEFIAMLERQNNPPAAAWTYGFVYARD